MTDRTVELVGAIYSALAGDATLTTLLTASGRVFNGAPDNQPAPYVDIGEATGDDYGSSSGDAQVHSLLVHAFTDQPVSGQSALKLCAQIGARIRAVLHDADLTLSSGDMPNLRCENTQLLRDPDGISWHFVLRFRAVSEN